MHLLRIFVVSIYASTGIRKFTGFVRQEFVPVTGDPAVYSVTNGIRKWKEKCDGKTDDDAAGQRTRGKGNRGDEAHRE